MQGRRRWTADMSWWGGRDEWDPEPKRRRGLKKGWRLFIHRNKRRDRETGFRGESFQYGHLRVYLLLLLLSRFSRVWLCVTPYTAAHQAPPSLGFSRQEHWSGLPLPSPMHESEKWRSSHSVVSDSGLMGYIHLIIKIFKEHMIVIVYSWQVWGLFCIAEFHSISATYIYSLCIVKYLATSWPPRIRC